MEAAMSEMSHLSEALAGFYEDPQNGWFLPITEAIKGLSAEQAAAVPAKGFNNVWAVVNHVWFCQVSVLLRLQDKPVDRAEMGAETDWPPVGDPMDEAVWQAACRRALETNQELAKCVAELNAKGLNAPVEPGRVERWKLIQGVIAHNSYHACEIISIRHMQGQWLKDV
jgi:uncharacterized damage-inducible protein DinB